jgi:hypothetical protein
MNGGVRGGWNDRDGGEWHGMGATEMGSLASEPLHPF